MSATPTSPQPAAPPSPKRRRWIFWVAVVFLVMAAIAGAIVWGISSALKSSDVYNQAVAKVNANAEAVRLLGAPITAGFPMGSLQVSGPSGGAQLSIPVEGPRTKGTIYLEATKELGAWRFDAIELQVDGRDERIDLGSSGPSRRPGKGIQI
jgi:hypothetical protein